MCKGTKIPILAGSRVLIVELTEFSFEPGGVIELFYFVMRALTVAVVFVAKNVVVVCEIGPSSVFFAVKIEANLALMHIFLRYFLPVRLHLIVLNVAISNLKNSPCSKKQDYPL